MSGCTWLHYFSLSLSGKEGLHNFDQAEHCCRFKLLVSYDISTNGFKQVQIAYLAVISRPEPIVSPKNTT